jgi:hypothetical protein
VSLIRKVSRLEEVREGRRQADLWPFKTDGTIGEKVLRPACTWKSQDQQGGQDGGVVRVWAKEQEARAEG